MDMIDRFIAFIIERQFILVNRLNGKEKPWTEDPILQNYRFCNVHREDDTVTAWIRDNWRVPHHYEAHVWFAMAVARLVNWPDTLVRIGYPVPWGRITRQRFLDAFDFEGKNWSSAYLVATGGQVTGSKQGWIAENVLDPLWQNRGIMDGGEIITLESFHRELMQFKGFGSFMAAQVVADVKYTDLLTDSSDWDTWSAPGPGSLRGMRRIFPELPVNKGSWQSIMKPLRERINNVMIKYFGEGIHAQDVQNCLCEFDKYERVRLKQGFPRQKYKGF